MGLGSKLKTFASPPKHARRVSAGIDVDKDDAGTTRPRSWSTWSGRRMPAAELRNQEGVQNEKELTGTGERVQLAQEDTTKDQVAPVDPRLLPIGRADVPRPHATALHSHVHAHASLQPEGPHVDQDTIHLLPVIHQTIRVLEIEEVTRRTERHTHVHHVQHHIMPIRLSEEIEIVEHAGFLYALAGATHANEDFVRLKQLVGEREEVIMHTANPSADGTRVHQSEHVHVHRIVRPLAVERTAGEEVARIKEALRMKEGPAVWSAAEHSPMLTKGDSGTLPARERHLRDGIERRTGERIPGAFPESAEGWSGIECSVSSDGTVCVGVDEDEDGRAFAAVGELLVRELADAGAGRRVVV